MANNIKINIPSRKGEKQKVYSERVSSSPKSINEDISNPIKIEGQYPFDYPSRHQPIEDQSPTVLRELVSGTDEAFPPDDYPVNMWVKLFRYLKSRVNKLFANHNERISENTEDIEDLKEDIVRLNALIGDGDSGVNLSGINSEISNLKSDVNTNKSSINSLNSDMLSVVEAVDDLKELVTPEQNGLMRATDKTILDNAISNGILNNAVFKNNQDANDYIQTGKYIIDTSQWSTNSNNHWPFIINSSNSLLEVIANNSICYQKLTATNGTICVRRCALNNNNNTWENWKIANYISNYTIRIYISKNGDDNNFGFTSTTPVLTVNRAVEIANSVTFSKPNSEVIFQFGAGDWGDIVFNKLKYIFWITPYNDQYASEYSEELPKFGKITVYGNIINIHSIICDYLCVYDTYLFLDKGYKRINSIRVDYNSICHCSNNVDNVLEICNSINYPNIAIMIIDNSSFIAEYMTIRLGANTNFNWFMAVYQGSIIQLHQTRTIIDLNGYTNNGKKFFAQVSSMTAIYNNPLNSEGYCTYIDNLPGTGVEILQGALFNGLPNNAVSKTGDVISSGLPYLDFKNTAYSNGAWTSYSNSIFLSQIKDKNNNRIYINRFRQSAVNEWEFTSAFVSLNSVFKGIYNYYNITDDYFWSNFTNSPKLNCSDVTVVTAGWVNQKLGTGASLISLANIDEKDPNYVETLEIKKQKAIVELNAEAQQAIYSNYEFDIFGKTYIFENSLFDQLNLIKSVILAVSNDTYVKIMCRDKENNIISLNIPSYKVLDIYKYACERETAILESIGNYKNLINKANTEEELHNILVEYVNSRS